MLIANRQREGVAFGVIFTQGLHDTVDQLRQQTYGCRDVKWLYDAKQVDS